MYLSLYFTLAADFLESIFNILMDINKTYPIIMPIHPRTKNKLPNGFSSLLKLSNEELLISNSNTGLYRYSKNLLVFLGKLQQMLEA